MLTFACPGQGHEEDRQGMQRLGGILSVDRLLRHCSFRVKEEASLERVSP